MKIIIVGAGISGLSLAVALAQAKHQVIILEAAAALAEIGAGVQMGPQAIKFLFQCGMKDDILARSIIPKEWVIRDHASGKALNVVPTGAMEARYGAPYVLVHRAVLHEILHTHAVKAGAELKLNSRVVNYDFDNGTVELHNGTRLTADLVVGADGINSFSRQQLVGEELAASKPTGIAAIRTMAPVDKVQADPLVADIADLTTYTSHFWISPKVSCMVYLIKDGTLLNIVISHPDDVDMSNFTLEEYQAFTKDLCKDFEPRVRRLIDLALPKMQNYPVYAVGPLPTWTGSSGRFTLLGDAAHAMAFYLSMGVSLAVEDAISLAAVLDAACPTTTPDAPVDYANLKKALAAFEQARMHRATTVQESSIHGGRLCHSEDDETRQKLYAVLKADGVKDASLSDDYLATKEITYGLGDQRLRDFCFGYDSAKFMKECYAAMA